MSLRDKVEARLDVRSPDPVRGGEAKGGKRVEDGSGVREPPVALVDLVLDAPLVAEHRHAVAPCKAHRMAFERLPAGWACGAGQSSLSRQQPRGEGGDWREARTLSMRNRC